MLIRASEDQEIFEPVSFRKKKLIFEVSKMIYCVCIFYYFY